MATLKGGRKKLPPSKKKGVGVRRLEKGGVFWWQNVSDP